MPTTTKIADFESPPVVEVVFGVMFEPVSLGTVQLGLLWLAMSPDDFPLVEDMPPISEATSDHESDVAIRISNVPPLRRVWFLSADKHRIIQVQDDRFHFNHRRDSLDQPYVDFVEAYPEFVGHYNRFSTTLQDNGHSAPKPTRYELTYINLIAADKVWSSLADIGCVLPDLSWRSKARFLPAPTDVRLALSFPMGDDGSTLRVTVRSGDAPAKGEPVLQLRLTASGPASTDEGAFESWFQNARSCIVRAFTDLTSDRMRSEIWKQRPSTEETTHG